MKYQLSYANKKNIKLKDLIGGGTFNRVNHERLSEQNAIYIKLNPLSINRILGFNYITEKVLVMELYDGTVLLMDEEERVGIVEPQTVLNGKIIFSVAQ